MLQWIHNQSMRSTIKTLSLTLAILMIRSVSALNPAISSLTIAEVSVIPNLVDVTKAALLISDL